MAEGGRRLALAFVGNPSRKPVELRARVGRRQPGCLHQGPTAALARNRLSFHAGRRAARDDGQGAEDSAVDARPIRARCHIAQEPSSIRPAVGNGNARADGRGAVAHFGLSGHRRRHGQPARDRRGHQAIGRGASGGTSPARRFSRELDVARRPVAVRDRAQGRRRGAGPEVGQGPELGHRRPLLPGKQALGSRSGQFGVFHQRLVSPIVRAAGFHEGQAGSATLRRRRLQDLGLRQRAARWHAPRGQRGVRLRNHAAVEGRLERVGGPCLRRSSQRSATRRQAGLQQERRLRLYTHYGHLAAGVAGSSWFVVCRVFLDRARSRPQPRADQALRSTAAIPI